MGERPLKYDIGRVRQLVEPGPVPHLKDRRTARAGAPADAVAA